MSDKRYQVGHGRDSKWVSEDYAIDGLKVIVKALEKGPAAWQSLSSLKQNDDPLLALIPSRAERLDVYSNLGDNPQVLIIKRPDVGQLAEKLDAALQKLEVLSRTNKIFNASVLLTPGLCAIVANQEGCCQIEQAPNMLEALGLTAKSTPMLR